MPVFTKNAWRHTKSKVDKCDVLVCCCINDGIGYRYKKAKPLGGIVIRCGLPVGYYTCIVGIPLQMFFILCLF